MKDMGSRESALRIFGRSTSKAAHLIQDKKKTKQTLRDAFIKANKEQTKLKEIWEKLMLLFQVAKDYTKGHYKALPMRSIIAIFGGLIYFISPIDALPDFIPFIGYIDDVFILSLVYSAVFKDLENYKSWRNTQATQKSR